MPKMGRPISNQERVYRNVTMAPKKTAAQKLAEDQIETKERKRLLDKITGFKSKNDLVVDGTKHNRMGKDEFLKLLTVQLQNQDPMNPMKQEKMAAELAQFSQLEQLSNLNEKFDGLTKNQQAQDKFYGASFLGKEVVTAGSSLKFDGEGTDADILYTLPKPAKKVLIRIFDNKNNMVGEIWKENIGRGNQTVTWDGMQLDNTISSAGQFKTRVFAWDQFADPIDVRTKTTGIVESVYFENGETVLKVDGNKVFLRDVDSFHNPGARNAPSLQPQSAKNTLRAENTTATNLPLEAIQKPKVNLKQINNTSGQKAYEKHVPTTGLTSVYDE